MSGKKARKVFGFIFYAATLFSSSLPVQAKAASAVAIAVDTKVEIEDGVIKGYLNAKSARGSSLKFSYLNSVGGYYGLGSNGGKITLGSSKDPQSFTILPYANWLDSGKKGLEVFYLNVQEDIKGGASIVVSMSIDTSVLAPNQTPLAFTYKVASFDGTLISTNFFPASGLVAGETAVSVLSGSGLGIPGDTDPYSDFGKLGVDAPKSAITMGVGKLRQLESSRVAHNVVTWDSRGTFSSEGELEYDSPFFEGRDVSALISWVAQVTPSVLNGPNDPAIAMVGGSYGGNVQLATVDPRIDALVVDNAWNSLLQSLNPNQRFKTTYASKLLASLKSSGLRVDKTFLDAINAGVKTGSLSNAGQAILENIGPTVLLNQLQAPTLFTHLIDNGQITLDQTSNNAQSILANPYGVPIKLIWYGSGSEVVSTAQAEQIKNYTVAWIDKYVAGLPIPDLYTPNLIWFDQNGDQFTSKFYPFNSGFNQTNPQTATSSGGTIKIVSGNRPSGGTVDVPISLDPGSQIVGEPVLTMTYTGKGSARHVFALIINNSNNNILGGTATPVPVVLDGKSHTVSIPLNDIVYTQGTASLKLQIVGNSPDYLGRLAGTVTLSAIRLDLPNRSLVQ